MMWKLLGLFSVLISVSLADEKSYINFGGFMCPRDEAALAECLKDGLNVYIPELATGLPEYGIPPCEPLMIPTLTIEQTAGPISITSTYTGVSVRGPASMRITNVEVNTSKHQVVATLHIPELRMKGHYKLSGKLLMLPVEGDGPFAAKYGDIDAVVTITLGRAHRDNAEDALACDHLDVKFNVGSATMQLENLFGGDSELGNTMNMFLNENWQKLAQEMQGPMEEALRDFLKPLADHAFGTLNADDILLR